MTTRMQRFRTTGGGEVYVNLFQVGVIQQPKGGENGCRLLVQGELISILEGPETVLPLINEALTDKESS